ncbi:MAG: DUF3791 domain-containing protein [Oscillospiraceae bacterium]|nr:DUF3791 domain-containing protein [Oscillospiraceae bacterium]
MPEIVRFKAFCLERYKHENNMTGKDTIRLFNQFGVLDYLGSFYDVLHTFGDKYIVEDIEQFIKERQTA